MHAPFLGNNLHHCRRNVGTLMLGSLGLIITAGSGIVGGDILAPVNIVLGFSSQYVVPLSYIIIIFEGTIDRRTHSS